ncbi:MAG: hypothetical protein HOO97_07385 [Sideroxydans sp.]|nr:hypothetical protein [Sideroxydans sp.]
MTRDEKEKFATDFLEIYLATGFGSLPKREIDFIVFHHLCQSREFRGKTNYEVASLLKMPESRIKSFRLTSALKYQEINSKVILGQIVVRLSKGQQFANIESGKLEISLEDPIERRELENFLKTKGHFAEYKFNTEVLRIAPIRLFELIVENLERPDEEFNTLVQQHIEDSAASERILDGAPTLKQKLARLRKEVVSVNTLTALLSGAAGAFSA